MFFKWFEKNKNEKIIKEKEKKLEEINKASDEYEHSEMIKYKNYVSKEAHVIIRNLCNHIDCYAIKQDQYRSKFEYKVDTVNVKILYDLNSLCGYMCEIYFNDVLVVPLSDVFPAYFDTRSIKWCDWIVELEKQHEYDNVLLKAQDILESIETKERTKKELEIQEKIRKIGI